MTNTAGRQKLQDDKTGLQKKIADKDSNCCFRADGSDNFARAMPLGK